jgi:hypothetical protein
MYRKAIIREQREAGLELKGLKTNKIINQNIKTSKEVYKSNQQNNNEQLEN